MACQIRQSSGNSCFCDEVVGNADVLPLCYGLYFRGHAIHALIQPRVEDFDWLVRIEGLLELPVNILQVRRRYMCIVRVKVTEEGQCDSSRVSGKRVLEVGEVCVLKYREKLISEVSVNVTAFIILSTLFGMLAEE